MMIYKCDICKKELEDSDEGVYVSDRGFFGQKMLCRNCGKPVLNFMKKYKLIKEDKKKLA